MFKAMHQMKNKFTRLAPKSMMTQTPKRFLSSPATSQQGYGTMAFIGIGTGVLGFLQYQAHQERTELQLNKNNSQMHYQDQIVRHRIKKTLMYLGGGLAITLGFSGILRNNPFALRHSFLLLILTFVLQTKVMNTDYDKQFVLKHLYWLGFMINLNLFKVPLNRMSGMSILSNAVNATAAIVSALSFVAYNAPSQQFLVFGGGLLMSCAFLIRIYSANILYFRNPRISNILLLAGLTFISGCVQFQMKIILENTKTLDKYDPIFESLAMYFAYVNILTHQLKILMDKKQK
ncbi:Transmembrane BAX inhibitor motif-containing protein 5 [Oxytricha trifallax]|uniref:Transmembrane BAX inhibitor motif-containing protein 5 n=1 Tax=Oxytricha trifallax TaxID=1172189 RepID=A0A073IC16_9SPIT|nr:Transmembrane BAX inhibitor motif-containing protein 5 [Oxytricha trifallax]